MSTFLYTLFLLYVGYVVRLAQEKATQRKAKRWWNRFIDKIAPIMPNEPHLGLVAIEIDYEDDSGLPCDKKEVSLNCFNNKP